MNTAATRDWYSANQTCLMAALEVVRRTLEGHQAGRSRQQPENIRLARKALESATTLLSAPSALERLSSTFGLSGFERDVLLLCAGMELTSDFASTLRDRSRRTFPALPNL